MNIKNMKLESAFNASEISVIERFCAFVAASNNQAGINQTESNFSIAETDDEIRENVRQFLADRYKRGHGQRKNS